MDIQLIQLYVLVCHVYLTRSDTCFQRLSNNYWRHFFPHLPAYQTFVARLNLLEPTFQAIGGYLQALLAEHRQPEIDHVVDSLPVMLAQGGHAYTARVGARGS
jgi:hypothetical protein